MRTPLRIILLLVSVAAAPRLLAAQGSSTAVEVRLASNSALEERGRAQLQRLLATYDLDRWIFTRSVRIESRVIPHSHPVLTLNTRYLDNDTAQVATFIHEQLHWFLVQREAATDSALADMRRLYPVVPSAPPEGARDEESTYLHLLVCMLELEGVGDIFGKATARRTLGAWNHYTWVYREVLERPGPLGQILRARGLEVP